MSTAVTSAPDSSSALNGAVGRQEVVVLFPEGVDPKPIEDALAQSGMEPLYLDDSPVSGSFDDILAERLSRAAAVLAIVVGRPAVAQVYAIGYARASGKRVSVLADDPDRASREQFPSDVQFMWGTLVDSEPLRLLVEDTRYPAGWPPKHTPRPAGEVLGARADALRARASAALDAGAVLAAVTEALAALRVEPAVNESTHLAAVWVDGLAPWIDNPTLIRAAGDVTSLAEWDTLVAEFGQTLRNRGCDWGLLVVGRLPPGAAASAGLRGSRVLAVSLPDFLAALREHSLADTMLDLRRRRVRGKG
jgi:hypothetical protein